MPYALVDPDNNIVRIEDLIGDDVGTKPGWRWLSVEDSGRPGYDPATQIIEGPFQEITATAVVKTWTIKNKTAEELAAEDRARVLVMDPKVLKVLLDLENKYRSLSNQDPIDTDAYVDYLRGVV